MWIRTRFDIAYVRVIPLGVSLYLEHVEDMAENTSSYSYSSSSSIIKTPTFSSEIKSLTFTTPSVTPKISTTTTAAAGSCELKNKESPKNVWKFDVLLYGSSCDHRNKCVERLRAAGLRVQYLTSCWGDDLKQARANSKIVLNSHYFNPSVLELARIVVAVEDNAFVISEYSDDSYLDYLFKDVVVFSTVKQLPRVCKKLGCR